MLEVTWRSVIPPGSGAGSSPFQSQRRAQQLKVAKQREKEWLKAQRSKDRLGNQHMSTYKRHITFEDSVVLLEAAARNDIAEVAKLLQKGVTPDATNMDGLTALHQCCIDDNAEMLNLLLDYGANVNAQDSERWTPLHAAATCGHLNLVKILIGRGANLLSVNADGNMPYDICDDEEALDYIEAEMSKRGVTQELIDETRAATETKMLVDLQETAARQDGDLEVPDSAGATPLHIASANGYTRVVEFLLEQHVATDAVDHDLWTPVHAAACWGHLEVLEMLAQAGADLNAKNKNDETPSDICEDPEIRERIEQLKTEQESKRLAEAQRKRVRRSQSNNTRAQSVRRTSLRDKGLTTKKDAVEEARFRLQAQESTRSKVINQVGVCFVSHFAAGLEHFASRSRDLPHFDVFATVILRTLVAVFIIAEPPHAREPFWKEQQSITHRKPASL
ncbi:phosphatase 1 regulatory inhibitor subunit 16a [Culex quinquefasciatus]|uniref:Phosphatase 1 regulatory inhibitor subunit 16a n=1 Tax=Culex quinquefasciatus TaxID=7176 RepID=B0XGV0_CULQU|nr:phosphatase 1 regulatory inhibitor subunit 16a [Culex quinquefasciatus]|eukprot:XP_001868872.1 phosphatase 1 regulatory inhibitor subunit 16a [Culex quinquefasciatus]